MAGNRLTLIKRLRDDPHFDGRFAYPTVVNCDPVTGERYDNGGCFSVIFQAHDLKTNLPVALKFFDPEFHGLRAEYRQKLFVRESQLLQELTNADRCLHLVQPLREFDIELYDPSADASISSSFQYFATEWLHDDVEQYFLQHDGYSTQEKLLLWREIALAVFMLHRHKLFHRDIKYNNVRIAPRAFGNVIVTIDLGTAAAVDSPPLGTSADYDQHVGAPAFAPLEAKCGLAFDRELGSYCDLYALGTMLHDLFNMPWHFTRQRADFGYQTCYGVCRLHMEHALAQDLSPTQLRKEWEDIISLSKHMVTLPDIDGPNTSIPAAIRDPLNDLLRRLTAVDYRDRLANHDYIIRRLDSALRILQNEAADRRARERKRAIRERRLAKRRARMGDGTKSIGEPANSHVSSDA